MIATIAVPSYDIVNNENISGVIPVSKNEAIVEIAQTANQFTSSIVLQYQNKYIDVKSILGLFTTLIDSHEYELHIHGPDKQEAEQAMKEIFEKHKLNVKVVSEL